MQTSRPSTVSSLLTLCSLSAVVVMTGCVEIDGQPIMQEVQQSSPCGKGVAKRQAVPKDLIDAFPTCCGGAAYLIPDWLIPKDFHKQLEKGKNNTLCVPYDFATNSDFTPKACKSIFGVKGACISECLPEVKNADVPLPQADCKAGDRCAPCVHPQTNAVTGACNFGQMACDPPDTVDTCKPWDPTLDLSIYPKCCDKGAAHCAPGNLVEENQRKDLNTCADGKGGTGYCVPDEILRRGGKHQPKTCKSINGREGRCISVCVKSVQKDNAMMPKDTCASDEVCAPCYDPRTGAGTGACTFGPCDKPKTGPKTFQPCGVGAEDALCVPSYLIPGVDRCNFDTKGCRSGCSEPNTLCVPKKAIDAGATWAPKTCKASMSGFLAMFMTLFSNPIKAFALMDDYSDGRCLSKCIPQVRDNPSAKMLSSKGCDADEICIPCYDPQKVKQGKVPTGACNRPKCPGY
jgi:hypothetical protein